LDIAPEFESKLIKVRERSSSNKASRADGIRDTLLPRKLVQVADDIVDHVTNEQFGEASEREAMDARTEALFDGSDRAFNFANVAISRNNVQLDGPKLVTDALKFMISMHVANIKTAVLVQQNCV
jgi:hypothetical protein